MSEKEQSIQQLIEIKKMMERSSRFLSLSGLSGVFAGIFALLGAAAFYVYINFNLASSYRDIAGSLEVDKSTDFLLFGILDAAIVLFLSLSFGIFFTTRKAKRDGLRIWDKSSQQLILNLAIPLATGGLFCLILLYYGLFALVAPCTLIFYGLALLNGAKYTLDEIKWLGISEISLGLVGCIYLGYGMTIWCIGFGVLHILYGSLMYFKHER